MSQQQEFLFGKGPWLLKDSDRRSAYILALLTIGKSDLDALLAPVHHSHCTHNGHFKVALRDFVFLLSPPYSENHPDLKYLIASSRSNK
jgi:hypothetical protein